MTIMRTSAVSSMGSPSAHTRAALRAVAVLVLASGLTAAVMTGAHALVGAWG